MIEVRNLNCDLGEFHLRDMDLKVNKGEYFVLLGPTGSGKTVLIEYLVGIYKPDGGSILVDGEDITPLYPEERNIGYVPQDYALFPNLTVEKNIAYGLEARGIPPQQVKSIAAEMIARLKIEYIRHRMPLNLSGGEKQRVALGRALATKPRVLLLDEPLSALDENLRTELARELRHIQKAVNGTFIHVCHSFDEASDVADRIAIMNDGRIIQTGTLEKIIQTPKNEFVARFLKSQNIFYGVTDGAVLKIKGLSLVKRSHLKGNVVVAIRPENITILENEHDDDQNVFSGKVERIKLKLYFNEILVDMEVPLVIFSKTEKKYKEGDKIKVRIPPEKIIVIQNNEETRGKE
ncbi:MAG: ABC transporter ATP-binding protein [Kiritimatiellae bacterium]|nr:ABC transporter ATP-binding protein [Kiritimatiellia bacterium]